MGRVDKSERDTHPVVSDVIVGEETRFNRRERRVSGDTHPTVSGVLAERGGDGDGRLVRENWSNRKKPRQ